jgi:hypothetical protein
MRKTMFFLFSLLTLLTLTFVLPLPAYAQSEGSEVSGVVLAIGVENHLFLLQTGTGQEVVVYAPADFDLTTLAVGATVTVSGTWNADGSFAASAIQLIPPAEEPSATPTPEPSETPTGEPSETPSEAPAETPSVNGFYCQAGAPPHPFGMRLAERYGVEYQQVQQYFCEGFGWGEIVLALHTARVMNGVDATSLLEARRNGQGWGEIWHGLGVFGRPKDTASPGDRDGDGLPDRLQKRDRDRLQVCTPPCTPQAPGRGRGRPDGTRTPGPDGRPGYGNRDKTPGPHGRGPKR